MIAYTMLGTNNPEAAHGFYEKLFEGTGVKVMFSGPTGAKFYGKPGNPMLAIGAPFDGAPACVGNGVMVALSFDTPEEVDGVYARAMAAGATSEGEPGWRLPDVFYGGYFRDPDGNKLCACKLAMGG